MASKKTDGNAFATAKPSAANFAAEKSKKNRKPADPLEYDVMRAEQLGYGCHYGQYKADHPETRHEFEALTGGPAKPAEKLDKVKGQRFCLVCGTGFRVKDQMDTKIYCCEDCRKKAYEAKKRGARSAWFCSWCGERIPDGTNRIKYCSITCEHDASRARARDKERQKREERKKADANP